MLFGLQAPAQADRTQILAAKNRPQTRMEQNPAVPSMQPGGFVPPEYIPGAGGQPKPAEAFQWAEGGQRLTPEDIAARRKLAQQQMATGMDFSPVAHWTQGVARVAQALVGSMEQKKLDKAAQQNITYEQQILQSLAGTGGGASNDPAMLAALGSPNLSDGAKDAIKLQWQATHKTPPQPSEFERALTESGVLPGTPAWTASMKRRVENQLNPYVNTQLPGGGFFSGPRDLFEQTIQEGGDQRTSGPPEGAMPPALPSTGFADFAGAQTLLQSMGQQGFLGWQKQHGAPVQVTSPEEMARLPVGTLVVSPDGRQGVKR
jgi:hypothetical protein